MPKRLLRRALLAALMLAAIVLACSQDGDEIENPPAPVSGTPSANATATSTPITAVPTPQSDALTVMTAADSGASSLRAAIEAANEDHDLDDIVFDFEAMGTDRIVLVSQLPDVTSTIRIFGADRLTLIGGGRGGHRHLYVGSTGDLAVIGVTLSNGGGGGTENDRGGAVFNHGGSLTIIDSTIRDSSASASGGVRNRGELRVTNSDFVGNGNAFGCAGGAIDNKADGTAVIQNSRFTGNVADVGGAVINDGGEMTITGSRFVENVALAWAGGGVLNDANGTMTITDSLFRRNEAVSGAGVTNRGYLLLEGVEISENRALEGGGGIGNFVGELTLRRVVVSDNDGGGILSGVDLTIEDSRIINNHGIGWGGVFSGGTLLLDSSLVAGNEATGGVDAEGTPVAGNGGGIFAIDGQFEIRHSLISDNTAAFGGGGVWVERGTGLMINSTIGGNRAGEPGAALHVLDARVELVYTTVVENRGATILFNNRGRLASSAVLVARNTGIACGGDRFSRAESSLADDSSCGAMAGYELVDDMGVAGLADNGGPTNTYALLADSPAIDRSPTCSSPGGDRVDRDQRDEPRPAGAACDVGAFEYR